MSNQRDPDETEAADDGHMYIRVRRRPDGKRRDLTLTLDALRANVTPRVPIRPAVGSIDDEIRRYLERTAAPAVQDGEASAEFEATPTVRFAQPAKVLETDMGRSPTLELFRQELGQLAETDEPAEITCGPAAEGPVCPTAPTLDFALPMRKPGYPDPQLCSCPEMVEATRGRSIIDVIVGGPVVFRTTLNVEDSAALCDDPYALARGLTAIRCCPFDGTPMDPHVPVRAKDVAGNDGSPYCCAWSREAHEASRMTLVTAKRGDMTVWSRFSASPAALWHCPNCGDKLMVLNHRRAVFYGHR